MTKVKDLFACTNWLPERTKEKSIGTYKDYPNGLITTGYQSVVGIMPEYTGKVWSKQMLVGLGVFQPKAIMVKDANGWYSGGSQKYPAIIVTLDGPSNIVKEIHLVTGQQLFQPKDGVYTGVTDSFFETGTEGVMWSVMDDVNSGYGSLHILNNGDRLEIMNKAGDKVEWKGTIRYNHKVGYKPYPKNPTCGQQVACGYYVDGIQCGFKPNAWGKLFFESRKCKLTLGRKSIQYQKASMANKSV